LDPKGHEVLTNQSVADAVRDFPPALNWVRYFLRDTMVGAVYRDSEDFFTGGHWSRDGQKHHFMRYQGQSPRDAYQTAVKWIYDNSYTAAVRLREIWQKRRDYASRVNPVYINEPLGNAIHALQDSYAEGHVTRKKQEDTYVIVDVLVYDPANRDAHGEWPGHAALDERWKTNDLGKEARAAGRELIRIVVNASLEKMDIGFEPKWNSLWDLFVSLFLVEKLPA
jgi:hypothetical protein